MCDNKIWKHFWNQQVVWSSLLNINLISNKSDQLKAMIEGKVDILAVIETKLDSTFPSFK